MTALNSKLTFKHIFVIFTNIKLNWKEQWNSKLKYELIITIIFSTSINIIYAKFLLFVEGRKGVLINDPILQYFKAVDMSMPIFCVLFSSLFISYWFFIKKPDLLILALKSYGFFVFFRIGAMFLIPLDPPEGYILLKDPIVESIATGSTILTRDLFYSGHTGDMFLMAFLARSRRFKVYLFSAGTFIACALLLQKVHYSIDVYCAPFFAYCAIQTAKKITALDYSNFSSRWFQTKS